GILDDYLPDDWGRKVLAQLAFYRNERDINQNSAIDVLTQLSDSRIGALQWVPFGEMPGYEIGCDIKHLLNAEKAAQSVDAPESYSVKLDEMSLLYLANAGTGIGGARPKALLHEDNRAYLAKFNRLTTDVYNNAKVELACLQMAKAAGLNVLDGQVRTGVNGRDVLLLDRFDIVTENKRPTSRRHLITINALLKNSETQRDKGGVFRYDDIVKIVRMHSTEIEKDLTQLLRIMLFNRAINNTDDHERNFSLINEGNGYTLSPGYDLVPSLTTGAYPVAGYGYSPWAPKPSEVSMHGKIFGLPKTVVSRVSDQVISAVEQWSDWAEKNDVPENDSENIKKIISL
ncbi:MAG: type II toxin-antitoxin system HipA family toxin, partial [Gammaproteobacteria bacterium]